MEFRCFSGGSSLLRFRDKLGTGGPFGAANIARSISLTAFSHQLVPDLGTLWAETEVSAPVPGIPKLHLARHIDNILSIAPRQAASRLGILDRRRARARVGRISTARRSARSLLQCRPSGGDASSPASGVPGPKRKPATGPAAASRRPRLRDWGSVGGARPRFRGRSLLGESDRAQRAGRRDPLVADALAGCALARTRMRSCGATRAG